MGVTFPPHQIHILAGASGSGKTTLLLQALASWERGQPFLSTVVPSKGVAYLVGDRTREEVDERVRHVKLERVKVFGIVDDLRNATSRIKALKYTPEKGLRDLIQEGFGDYDFDILVIDPIFLFLQGKIIDYQDIALSLITLNQFATERNLTLFAAHHATKARTDFTFKRSQDRISGSSAFQGFSGTQMILIDTAESGLSTYDLHVIPHTMPPRTHAFVRGEDGYFIAVAKKSG